MVVHSVVLCEAPAWAESVSAARPLLREGDPTSKGVSKQGGDGVRRRCGRGGLSFVALEQLTTGRRVLTTEENVTAGKS